MSVIHPQQINQCFSDLNNRLRDGITNTLQQRSALYDLDVRNLEALKGTNQLDFRALFLTKESLALMYQMIQLPVEALKQYEVRNNS
jgi:hypothetical protein